MRRHDQNQMLPASLFLSPSRGRNAHRTKGQESCESATSASAELTDGRTRFRSTSCAPAGLPTEEKCRSEIAREKKMISIWEKKANELYGRVKKQSIKENLIQVYVQGKLDEERRKQDLFKRASKKIAREEAIRKEAERKVRSSFPVMRNETLLKKLIDKEVQEALERENKTDAMHRERSDFIASGEKSINEDDQDTTDSQQHDETSESQPPDEMNDSQQPNEISDSQ